MMTLKAENDLINETVRAIQETSQYSPHQRSHLYRILQAFGEAYHKLVEKTVIRGMEVKATFVDEFNDPGYRAECDKNSLPNRLPLSRDNFRSPFYNKHDETTE